MTIVDGPDSCSVSVVVTTYERPELCKRALRSVAAQTYEPDEIVVVEDASESGIEDWLEAELPDATYVRHDTNRGLAATRNTGLSVASGDYVAYLDDDDEWLPARLKRQIATLEGLSDEERRDVGAVNCGVERRNPAGETLSIALPDNEGDLAVSIRDLGASTYPSTFLFRRAALETVGGFDESLPSSIDHDIWMELAVAGFEVRRVMEPLVITYISPREQMTGDTAERISGVRQYLEKWLPTYREWFGEEGGQAYADRYFARVIARLAASNFVCGDLRGFITAVTAIFQYSDETWYNRRVVFTTVARRIVSEVVPTPVKRWVKSAG
ncbi:glycosyltransferase family 2 protein [Haloarcula salina]|uniref:glycosyltransferase family 2 protein n=1 Tax=Haloarcula salina TaxID=1429914 RepID=UPI003C6FE74D